MFRVAPFRPLVPVYRWGTGRGIGTGTGSEPGSDRKYRQGQSPAPRQREYFYWVDANGRLYLDDAKVKNFTTCFKDERFLSFFFRHLGPNDSGRYVDSFPFVSHCGPERNYVRCQDLPIVFNGVLEGDKGPLLSYNWGGRSLTTPFLPHTLTYWAHNGRVYHPGPKGGGGVGLVTSALVELWGDGFRYGAGDGESPTHLVWGGRSYELKHPLLGTLRDMGRLWGDRERMVAP